MEISNNTEILNLILKNITEIANDQKKINNTVEKILNRIHVIESQIIDLDIINLITESIDI